MPTEKPWRLPPGFFDKAHVQRFSMCFNHQVGFAAKIRTEMGEIQLVGFCPYEIGHNYG